MRTGLLYGDTKQKSEITFGLFNNGKNGGEIISLKNLKGDLETNETCFLLKRQNPLSCS